MKRKIDLPQTLRAGLFVLVGFFGSQQKTLAQVMVLQAKALLVKSTASHKRHAAQ
jgi:hypothetical protein